MLIATVASPINVSAGQNELLNGNKVAALNRSEQIVLNAHNDTFTH